MTKIFAVAISAIALTTTMISGVSACDLEPLDGTTRGYIIPVTDQNTEVNNKNDSTDDFNIVIIKKWNDKTIDVRLPEDPSLMIRVPLIKRA